MIADGDPGVDLADQETAPASIDGPLAARNPATN